MSGVLCMRERESERSREGGVHREEHQVISQLPERAISRGPGGTITIRGNAHFRAQDEYFEVI